MYGCYIATSIRKHWIALMGFSSLCQDPAGLMRFVNVNAVIGERNEQSRQL
jgi:hypothetical protein